MKYLYGVIFLILLMVISWPIVMVANHLYALIAAPILGLITAVVLKKAWGDKPDQHQDIANGLLGASVVGAILHGLFLFVAGGIQC